ncbi:hypothetical protein JCM8097_009451 [Rhodosporidiobolus ruineniae]
MLRCRPLRPRPPPPASNAKQHEPHSLPPFSVRHDLAAEPLREPSLSIHTSALLQPFRHLLDVRPPSPPAPTSPVTTDSFERVEADDYVRSGALSAGPSSSDGVELVDAPVRRNSFASSMLWSTGGGAKERATSPPPALDLDPEEEERLADEWGLSQALSAATSDFETGMSTPASPTSETGNMAGVGLARFPTSLALSEAGLLDQERKAEALADAAADEDVELLETRSMPDLERPRVVSFAEAVLGGLDQRLKERAAVKAVVGSSAARGATTDDEDETRSEGPRIKILERTASERARGGRARTQSLGPTLGLASLPTFGDLTTVTEASSASGTSGGRGLASQDPLFLGPRSRPVSSSGVPSAAARSATGYSASRRGSTDALSVADALTSRLSMAIPGTALSSSSGPRSPISPTSPTSAGDPTRPRRPSTSLSFAVPPPDEESSSAPPLSPSDFGFTSRFDPRFIAAQRAELVKDRPKFSNADAGKPPKVVLMPAPLAGRPPSPVRAERPEGPDSGDEDGEEEDEPEEEEPEQEEEKDQRPAGALYGRSLMDVIAERKAVQKARQKAFVSGTDGRRQMFEWKQQEEGEARSPEAEALAKLEGHAGADEDGKDDDVPLALVPAGGAQLVVAKKKAAARAGLPHSKSTVSIFGPDLIYQRELARAKELEAEERAEREKLEAIEAARREKERIKEEKRKSRAKLRRKSQMSPAGGAFPALQTSQEWEAREGKSPAKGTFEVIHSIQPPAHLPPASPPRQRASFAHTLAPSLSIPAGLGALRTSASGGDWFRPPSPPVKLTNDSEDEEDEEELYRPRPISSLGVLGGGTNGKGRMSRAFESDESSDEEEDLDHAASLSGPASLSPTSPSHAGHLPLPGEPSSIGHGTANDADSIAETDEQPLGVRYSRQSFTLQRQVPPRPAEEEDEDDEPLGKRYSRLSLALPLHLPAVPAGGERLDLDFSNGEPEREQHAERRSTAASDDSEDDKPLGVRYSTVLAGGDDDDAPLAIHRLSLAPQAQQQAQRYQPMATLHAVDDDGKTVASENSDDRPLGLKAAAQPAAGMGALGFGFPPAVAPGFPPQLPYAPSQFFPPPMAVPVMPPYGVALPPSTMPVMPPPMPMPGQDPSMQLALAQMQMHAAMQQQQAAVMGGALPPQEQSAGIEAWRRGVL